MIPKVLGSEIEMTIGGEPIDVRAADGAFAAEVQQPIDVRATDGSFAAEVQRGRVSSIAKREWAGNWVTVEINLSPTRESVAALEATNRRCTKGSARYPCHYPEGHSGQVHVHDPNCEPWRFEVGDVVFDERIERRDHAADGARLYVWRGCWMGEQELVDLRHMVGGARPTGLGPKPAHDPFAATAAAVEVASGYNLQRIAMLYGFTRGEVRGERTGMLLQVESDDELRARIREHLLGPAREAASAWRTRFADLRTHAAPDTITCRCADPVKVGEMVHAALEQELGDKFGTISNTPEGRAVVAKACERALENVHAVAFDVHPAETRLEWATKGNDEILADFKAAIDRVGESAAKAGHLVRENAFALSIGFTDDGRSDIERYVAALERRAVEGPIYDEGDTELEHDLDWCDLVDVWRQFSRECAVATENAVPCDGEIQVGMRYDRCAGGQSVQRMTDGRWLCEKCRTRERTHDLERFRATVVVRM